MKKISTIIASVAVTAACLVSCNDLKNIEDRVDSLENRVQALEKVCESINKNVEALQAFTQENKSISSFTEKDGVYTIELSDGKTITLNQGSEGEAVMPEIAIDKDGFWTLDGKQILSDGKPVPATGNDGATPIFGVDKDGYWTVKYSVSETPVQVLDVNGNPVKAVSGTPGEQGGNDKFFEKVEVVDDSIEITLKGGQKYSLPIVPDFVCAIQGIELQPVMFALGEQKTFNVKEKNVAEAIVYAPARWNATLDNGVLTVEAPATLTKASADSRQDVAILAVSNTGFSAITKVRVQLSDAPVIETPAASAVAGEATENSVSFTVSLSNTTEWYYMLKKSSEKAPTAEEVKAANKGSQEMTLTLTEDNTGAGLSASTEYTLYILPVNASGEGSVASAKNTTTSKSYNSLLDKYNDGQDIMIAGRPYNKSVYGEAGHITAASPKIEKTWDGSEKTAPKVLFVDADADAEYTFTGGIKHMIIIGNDPAKRSPLKTSVQIKLNQDSELGTFVMSGIDFNSTAANNYPFVQNYNGAHEYFCLDNCHIKVTTGKHITYVSSAVRSFKTFVMNGCEFEVYKGGNVINVGSSTAQYENLIFTNNIFYNPANDIIDDFRLFNGNKAVIGTVTLNNNTIVNLQTSGNGAISVAGLSGFECTKNLIFIDKTMDNNSMFLRAAEENGYPASGDKIKDNIVYKDPSIEKNFQIVYNGINSIPGSEETKTIKEDPFKDGTFDIAGCRFIPNSNYAGYGAQR